METRQPAFLSRLISRRPVQRAHGSFDSGSGQVFSETHCPMTSMVPSWVTATTGSLVDLVDFRNVGSVGAACLEQVAIRSVLLQLDRLDCETLACVPWTIGKKIWACVRRYRLDSLRTWRLFVRAYPDERDAFQETRKIPLTSSKVHYRLDDIVKQITAPKFEWITHLTLQDPDLSKPDWAKLAKIRNLGVLLVLGPNTATLDDRVVKGWSAAAKEEHAFSRLRLVLLINQPSITARSLLHLRKLPALTLCNLTGCDVDVKQAKATGWKACGESPSGHELNTEWIFSANVFDALSGYYRRAKSPDLSSPKQDLVQEPVLSLFRRATAMPMDPATTLLWFRRTESEALEDSRVEETPVVTEPPKKKRKLRATKEKALDDIFGSLM